MFLFIIQTVLSLSSPAFASEPNNSEKKTLAFIVGVGFEREWSGTLGGGSTPPAIRAAKTAEALKGRVDDITLLNTAEDTTCENINEMLEEAALSGYAHLIFVWYGPGLKQLSYGYKLPNKQTVRVPGPKGGRFACSDLNLFATPKDGFSYLEESSLKLTDLAEKTQRIGTRQTILFDSSQPSSVIIYGDRGQESVAASGVTAEDWGKDDNAFLISSMNNSADAPDMAFFLTSALRDNQGTMSYNGLVKRLESTIKIVDENKNTTTFPVISGANIDPFWEFVRPMKRDVPLLKPDPVDVKPPIVIIEDPKPVVKPKSRKKLWYTSLGVSAGCGVVAAISGANFLQANNLLNVHPEKLETEEQAIAAKKRFETFGPITAVTLPCAVGTGALGGAGLVFKW